MTESPAPSAPPTKRKSSVWRELLETAVLTLAIFLGVRIALQNFRVDGESMYPNLHDGEYILVDKLTYMFRSPQRGDIVVFKAVPAGDPDKDFIKRIVGLPGDTVAVHSGKVFIDGHVLREPYLRQEADYTFASQKVPPSDYFVLGDNRNDSYDSSKWVITPWLPRGDIIGKAWIAYWPLSDISILAVPDLGWWP